MTDDIHEAGPEPAATSADDPGPELPASADAAGAESPPTPSGAHKHARGHGSFFRELPFLILVAFGLALLIKAFVIQAFFIPSGSMERTLLVHDRVLVNKLVYHFRDIRRGEIVVFNGKGTNFPQETFVPPATNIAQRAMRDLQRWLGLGAPSEKDYIKRVIGLPGDRVRCCVDGKVVVNDHVLDEPYVYDDNHEVFCAASPGAEIPNIGSNCPAGSAPYVVPPGKLFVMGDHRGASSDSRPNGPIPKSSVVGQAFIRVWPLGRFSTLGIPSGLRHADAAGRPVLADPSYALGLAGALPVTLLRRRRRRRRLRR